MEPLPLIAVAWFGLVLGDALVFHWGHRFGPRILGTRFVSRIVAPQRLAEFQGRVRHGGHAGPSSLAERIALWYVARKRSRQR